MKALGYLRIRENREMKGVNIMGTNRYDAFISYRHLALDKAIAIKLQYLLETYKPPKGITLKNTNRIKRIFRDESELPTSGDLGGNIRNALEQSDFLILVCSRETIHSKWCMEEVNYFIRLHNGGTNNILTVLVDGEPHDVFPPALCTQIKGVTLPDSTLQAVEQEIEPLCTDVRADAVNKSVKRLKAEFLRIAAPILGCGYDDLYGRHKRRKRQQITKIAFAAAFFTIISGIAIYEVTRQIESRDVSIQDQQRQIENQNNAIIVQQGKIETAAINEKVVETEKNIEAGKRISTLKSIADFAAQYKGNAENYKIVKENMNWLALKANYVSALSTYEAVENENSDICYSSEGNYLVTYAVTDGKTGNVNIYDKYLVLKYAVPITFKEVIYNMQLRFDESLMQLTLKYEDGSILSYDLKGNEIDPASWEQSVSYEESVGFHDSKNKVILKDNTVYMNNNAVANLTGTKPDIAFADEWHSIDGNILCGLFSDINDSTAEYDPFGSGGIGVINLENKKISYIPIKKPMENFAYDNVRVMPSGEYVVVSSTRGVYEYNLDIYNIEDGSRVSSLDFSGNMSEIQFCTKNNKMVILTNLIQQDGTNLYKIAVFDPDDDSFKAFGDRTDYIIDMIVSGDNLYILSESELDLATFKDLSLVDILGKNATGIADMDLSAIPEYSADVTKLCEDGTDNFILNAKWQPKMLAENAWSGGVQSVEMLKKNDNGPIFNFLALGDEEVFYNEAEKLFGFKNGDDRLSRAYRLYSFDELTDLVKK